MNKKISIAWAVLALALVVTPAAASAAQEEVIPTFDSWLKAVSGPLVSVVVGVVLSWLVEWWPAYSKWPSKKKRLIYLGLCLVVPVAAAALRVVLGYVIWSFDPLIWHALWSGAAAFAAGTAVHTRKLPGS